MKASEFKVGDLVALDTYSGRQRAKVLIKNYGKSGVHKLQYTDHAGKQEFETTSRAIISLWDPSWDENYDKQMAAQLEEDFARKVAKQQTDANQQFATQLQSKLVVLAGENPEYNARRPYSGVQQYTTKPLSQQFPNARVATFVMTLPATPTLNRWADEALQRSLTVRSSVAGLPPEAAEQIIAAALTWREATMAGSILGGNNEIVALVEAIDKALASTDVEPVESPEEGD